MEPNSRPQLLFRRILAGAGEDFTAGTPGPSVSRVSGGRKLRPVEQQLGPAVSSSHVPAHQPALAEPAASADSHPPRGRPLAAEQSGEGRLTVYQCRVVVAMPDNRKQRTTLRFAADFERQAVRFRPVSTVSWPGA